VLLISASCFERMSSSFNIRFNDNKHTTHPEASSSHNSPYNDQAEYEQLLSKENGISHEKKQTIDNYDNRSPEKGLGSCGTAINTIKCSVGAGILSFPYAFQLAGWLGAVVAYLTILLPVLYCLHTIGTVRCMIIEDKVRNDKMTGLRADPSITEDEVKRLATESREYLEYPDLAERAVGRGLRRIVASFVLLGQIGCCSAYVIFMANNLYTIGQQVTMVSTLPRFVYIVALLPLLVCLSFVKTLRGLMPIAVFGTILLVAGLSIVCIHGFQVAAHENRVVVFPPMIGDNVVVCIGIMLFAMEAVNQMPALQASMTKPSKFPFVLNSSMFALTFIYLGVGIVGASLYGKNTDSVITQNMGTSVLGYTARGLFVLMLLSTFPFQMFPAGVIMERWFKPTDASGNVDVNAFENRRNQSTCYSLLTNFYTVRIFLCLVVAGLAISFDNFGKFLSLIGYPCMGTLGLVIPPLMCLSLDMRSKEGRLSYLDRIMCWVIMCFGAIGCIIGTVYSVAAAMKRPMVSPRQLNIVFIR
jgi:proton-coupled amino acid transporter